MFTCCFNDDDLCFVVLREVCLLVGGGKISLKSPLMIFILVFRKKVFKLETLRPPVVYFTKKSSVEFQEINSWSNRIQTWFPKVDIWFSFGFIFWVGGVLGSGLGRLFIWSRDSCYEFFCDKRERKRDIWWKHDTVAHNSHQK